MPLNIYKRLPSKYLPRILKNGALSRVVGVKKARLRRRADAYWGALPLSFKFNFEIENEDLP